MATKTHVTDHKMQEIKHLLCTRFDDVLLSFSAKEETWKLRQTLNLIVASGWGINDTCY